MGSVLCEKIYTNPASINQLADRKRETDDEEAGSRILNPEKWFSRHQLFVNIYEIIIPRLSSNNYTLLVLPLNASVVYFLWEAQKRLLIHFCSNYN
jgi:hypothetical protein